MLASTRSTAVSDDAFPGEWSHPPINASISHQASSRTSRRSMAAGMSPVAPSGGGGGDGGRDFLPFCSTLAANAFPKDWLAVQLVAPQWRPERR